MSEPAEKYFANLIKTVGSVRLTDGKGRTMDLNQAVEAACRMIRSVKDSGHKMMFIGNGGSAAISSHMSVDFWKNARVRAVSFNDGPQLTCLGNDYGYEYVFEKAIEMFADPGDLLISISSSGRSENILRGVRMAAAKGAEVITLSGFDGDNPLSTMGRLNFYVPASSYGFVEVIHHSICHCVLDCFRHSNPAAATTED